MVSVASTVGSSVSREVGLREEGSVSLVGCSVRFVVETKLGSKLISRVGPKVPAISLDEGLAVTSS